MTGEPGDFRVKILQKPRFIDLDKCTGCGECAAVCPVVRGNEYDMSMSQRKAVYRPYAQAVPGAFAIDKRGTPPCKVACPAHISVQGYLALAAQGRYREALRLIKEENPLPAICGRVCHHPCEGACKRGELDQPVAIDSVKRFLADLDLRSETRCIPEIKARREEKAAIIGSGPAGLTCAYFLAIEGYQVTVFEKLPVLGGMLRVGIPVYRLPRDILEAEIQVIESMGVEFKTGVAVGKDVTISQLRADGYKAFFIAIGSHECKALGIPGENLEGVVSGIDYLREVNLGRNVPLGDRVAVIGGGNVAMDAVRTSLRRGSRNPFIVYRRSCAEMPASNEEIEECLEEGIQIMTLTNPVRIIGENGKVKAMECVRMELGEPDAGGRRRPLPIEGSEFIMEVDAVIPAIGQESDWACLTPECACRLSDWGTMRVDPLTYQSDDPDIFAGGDAVSGPRTVVEAIAAGKQAATSMDRFMRGLDMREGREKEWEAVGEVPTQGVHRVSREVMPRLPVPDRLSTFDEVQLGFSEEQVRKEAARCLGCGICSECGQCVEACLAHAITRQDVPRTHEIKVGAVILAPGFQPFDPAPLDTYGYRRYPNVVTSMEFERILSASGPTQGHLVRPSDHGVPRRVAWLQCVGSRDINQCGNGYCSSICCMVAVKQAVIAREHANGGLETAIFTMDLRTVGKDFERYAVRARDEGGVRFVRSRIHTVEEIAGSRDLLIHYVDSRGTAHGESFDLVVLSVGMTIPEELAKTAASLGIELDAHHFVQTGSFRPVETSRKGVYACGAFTGPKDIPTSVMEAGASACAATESLASARHSETKEIARPPERNVGREPPRIGVFVCNCGVNIGGVVKIPELVAYTRNLPHVVHVEDNLFSCSQDTQDRMKETIRAKALNRVVVAACTPRTHEPLFQETLVNAGLNKYLFEMANIRNHDSWVHSHDPATATEKAKDLVRMAVVKSALLYPLHENELPVTPSALVIGGGIAGMTAALALARHGYPVHLIEKSDCLGGNALRLHKTHRGEPVSKFLEEIIEEVNVEKRIVLHLGTTVCGVEGFVGNFKTKIKDEETVETIAHGVTIIATGAKEYKPTEYLYGKHPAVVTQLEMDSLMKDHDPRLAQARNVAFIQCVGSREDGHPYCSKVCCTHTVRTALEIKEMNPDMGVHVLYRDMRTYGTREDIYREAKSRGVLFFPYYTGSKPVAVPRGDQVRLLFRDEILDRDVALDIDLLCLATAIEPHRDHGLDKLYKVPMDADGWFLEAHQKLRPVDFATDGVFLCGMAHYPKPIEESIAQALAAVSRSLSLLSRRTILVGGIVAQIHAESCSGCLACVSVCPFGAISLNENLRAAEVNAVMCKGCGACAATCPSEAATLRGFSSRQLYAQIKTALAA